MDILPVAVGSFLLLAAVVYLVLRPAGGAVRDDESPRHALEAERGKQIEVIRDLDLDLATGKLSAEDHARMRAAAVTRAAELMRDLDRAQAAEPEPAPATEPEPAPMPTSAAEPVVAVDPGPDATTDLEPAAMRPEDVVERAIAARRREMERRTCPGCGAAHAEHDRFCRVCGEAFVTTGRQVGT